MLTEIYKTWPRDYSRLPSRPRPSIHTMASRLGLTSKPMADYSGVDASEWAYLAGFFDGEGTVWLNEGERTTTKQAYSQAIVSVCNTNWEVMRWIAEMWPGGTMGLRADRGERWKDLHTYRWTRHGTVVPVLQGMLPYLIVKRDKTVDMLTHLTTGRFSALT